MNLVPTGKHSVNIQCKEQVFSEFPLLLAGEASDSKARYFDATAYINSLGSTNISAEKFLQDYFHPINALIQAYQLDPDYVCVKNHEGHLLISGDLVYLFLSYTHPEFLAYLTDRVDEMMTRGFAVSDNYLYHTARQRINPELFLLANSDEERSD